MDERFKQRLEESMWIHKPLTVDETQIVEYINKNKKVIHDTKVWEIGRAHV